MNWHKKLYKFAGPKDKIKKYNVDDPSLKFFIYKYEKTIPWDKINSAEDIQAYVQNALLPILHDKIDPAAEDNYYLSADDIDIEAEFQNHPNDPEIVQAYEIYQRDPEAATEKILTAINSDKQNIFDSWWNYITQENEIYAQNPAFAYSILKPVIDSSPTIKKTPPPPLNPEALAKVYGEINEQGATQMNIIKKYTKESAALDKESLKTVRSGEGEWVNVPSKDHDPTHFQENVNKLKRFSTGNHWCTAEAMAEPYLSQGDFWLYLKGGRAVVAIRLVGNRVQEIRGKQHPDPYGQETLKPYWKEVTQFLANTDYDYSNNQQYKMLQELQLFNEEIEIGNDERINELIDRIRKDPKNYDILTDINKRKFPQFAQAAAEAYEERLHASLERVRIISRTSRSGYVDEMENFTNLYDSIPEEVRIHLSPEIMERSRDLHRAVFEKNPPLWADFPEDIKRSIPIAVQVEAWQRYIADDPYRYRDEAIPNAVRQQIPLEDIAKAWEVLIQKNSRHIDYIPEEIKQLFPPDFIKNVVVTEFQKYPFSQTREGYDKLNRVKPYLTDDAIVAIYQDALTERPDLFNMVPPEYRDKVAAQGAESLSPVIVEQKEKILKAPQTMMNLPPDMQAQLMQAFGTEIAQLFNNLRPRFGNNLHQYWASIPEVVKPSISPDIRNEVVQYYQMWVDKKPDFIKQVPPDLSGEIRTASYNWYRKILAGYEYPIADPPEYAHSNYAQLGGKIVFMSPAEFLQQVKKPLDIDEGSRENIDELKSMIQNGQKIDPPNLYTQNGEVVDNDGRHRATAAMELGLEKIPVLIMEI